MSEARRRATYEDLSRLPGNVVGEIVGGELYASPRPAPRHAQAGTSLGADVHGAYGRRRGPRGPGGWLILFETELHLGDDIVVPDIAGWRRERMPRVPEEAAFTVSPDWICEVLSPATARLDRYRKLPVYARAEVGHAWIVDPVLQALEFYRRQGEHWVLIGSHAGDDLVQAEPFGDVAFDPTEWWLDPGPDETPTRPL